MSGSNPIVAPKTPSKSPEDGKEASSSSSTSWSSRIPLSTPPLPSFRPNMAGLRTALLGYLGEVERALQGQVQVQVEQGGAEEGEEREWVSSCDSTADETEDEAARSRTSAIASSSTSTSMTGLRQRGVGGGGSATATTSAPTALNETNMSLLAHLSALREDVRAYLHSVGPPISMSVPSMPMPHGGREWLRSLPSRLSVVDIGVDSPSPLDMESKGKGRLPNIDLGAVTHARKRVLETVRTLLPSEEWAGWERLGWEDQEEENYPPAAKGRRRTLSASIYRDIPGHADGADEEDGDDGDEPEYLFPNRTPASQQAMAIATRRRAIRSTSFNAALLSRHLVDEDDDDDDEGHREGVIKAKFPGFLSAPLSRRTTGLPDHGLRAEDANEAEEQGDELEMMSGTLQEKLELEELKRLFSEEDVGPTLSEALRRAEDGKKLITYADLPFWWRNNEHIISGYRFIPLHATTGPIPLIKSAFSWHNETVNIHSHFIPTILIMLAIPFVLYASPLPDPHPLDTYIVALYLLAAVSCLSSSAGWHVLAGCASKKWFEWGACVDYIGISWLIAASFGTVAYNGFYCQPKSVLFFCSTNALCGALGSYLPFQRWFNERKYKNWRIAFFLFLNFAMIAPMVQLFYQHGYEKGSAFVAPFSLSVLTYVVGLLFYAFHVPECIWPGKFDIWGNSHQIWHAAIVGAIILHYRAVFVAHGQRYNYSCAMPEAGRPVGEVWDDLWRRAAGAIGGA